MLSIEHNPRIDVIAAKMKNRMLKPEPVPELKSTIKLARRKSAVHRMRDA
jgi:hypothetical protein